MWQYFIDAEKSGKKKTPEEVHMLLRKDLQPQDYVTPWQIKSLYSCWTREKASIPPKLSSVSEDTYEDVMEGVTVILCSIYYCKILKYFCLNELLYFACISIYMLQNEAIFKSRMGCKI